MEFNYLTGAIEAVLFASGRAMEREKLAAVLEIDEKELELIVQELIDEYKKAGRGYTIVKLDECYQMCSNRDYGEIVKRALDHRRNAPLSNAALEIIAIIAYNQPVTKSFIEQIRGVDCFYGINALVEKGIIEEKGRLDVPGRPKLYGTSKDFLRCFNVESLEQLPPLPTFDKENITEGEQQSLEV